MATSHAESNGKDEGGGHRAFYKHADRPNVLRPVDNLPDVFPAELLDRPQWVLWALVWRDGAWAKIPHTTDGGRAKANDPSTWSSFADVWKHYQANKGRYDGVGFEFSALDPYSGVDLDDGLQRGKFTPWAQQIVDRFKPAYCEVSPSGTGAKLWCRGEWKGDGNRYPYQGGEVEVYSTGRFFCVTGRVIGEAHRASN